LVENPTGNYPSLAVIEQKAPGLIEMVLAAASGDEEATRRLGALARYQELPLTTLQ
jgi:hypothetical protein